MTQHIEDVGGVAYADVYDLGTKGRVLVRDMGVEEFARFGAVLGIDVAGAFGLASSPEALPIRGRGGSIAPVFREGLPGLSVYKFGEGGSIGLIAEVPGLQLGQFGVAGPRGRIQPFWSAPD